MTTRLEFKARRLTAIPSEVDEPRVARLRSEDGAEVAKLARAGASVSTPAGAEHRWALGSGLVVGGALASVAALLFLLRGEPVRDALRTTELATATPSQQPSLTAPSPSADEAALLDDARRALSRSRTGAALALLDVYDRSFPSGNLRVAAASLRIVAWCAAGRVDRARAEAQQYAARSPGSGPLTAPALPPGCE